MLGLELNEKTAFRSRVVCQIAQYSLRSSDLILKDGTTPKRAETNRKTRRFAVINQKWDKDVAAGVHDVHDYLDFVAKT